MKRREKGKQIPPDSISGPSARRAISLPLAQLDLYKVDRALLNMNSKIFFRRMTAVLTVTTQLQRISSHLRKDAQLSRCGINSSVSKTCFVKSIFAHILRLIIPNRFHLLLKVLLHSKFFAKSTYRLLKRPLRKQMDRNTTKSKTLFGVAQKHKMLPDVTQQMTSGWTPSRYTQAYQPSPQSFSARSIRDSTVNCDVTERDSFSLSQPSRGQRVKRERLGTKLQVYRYRLASRLCRQLTPRAVHSLRARNQ